MPLPAAAAGAVTMRAVAAAGAVDVAVAVVVVVVVAVAVAVAAVGIDYRVVTQRHDGADGRAARSTLVECATTLSEGPFCFALSLSTITYLCCGS